MPPTLAAPPLRTHPSRLGDATLFARCAGGDLAAREALVARFRPMAEGIAGRYRNRGIDIEDLRQIAYLGLVKAIDRYDPELGGFRRYAVPSIMGDIKRHFRDAAWALHVPRSMQELVLAVNAASAELNDLHRRAPRTHELAARTGASVDSIREARVAGEAYTATSLDGPAWGAEREPEPLTLLDRVGADDPHFAATDLGRLVREAFAEMPATQQAAVRLSVLEDLRQADIAERLGISQMQVSRLLRRAADSFRQATAI